MPDTYIPAELRRQVVNRADNCCEYCRLHQDDNFFTFHVDHIISQKHNGDTTADNLCLSCPRCNQAKGSDIAGADPQTDQATFLYNPRQQTWENHFSLDDGEIRGKTPEGRLTVSLLDLNGQERVAERKGLVGLGRYPCAGS